MPACQIQCGNEPDYDCGTCHHRNLDYPWPGGADGSMVIKTVTTHGVASAPVLQGRNEEYALAILSTLFPWEIWSHWE